MLRHLVRSMATKTVPPLRKYPVPVPSTPLALAAVGGELSAIEAADLATLDAQDDTGNTPLIWASDAGRIDVVKAIVAKGGDVNKAGFIGNTALARAARQGHTEIARTLLSAPGCTCQDVCNSKSQYPLHFAAFKQHADTVRVMLELGCSSLVVDRKGRTPAEDTSSAEVRDMIVAARQ